MWLTKCVESWKKGRVNVRMKKSVCLNGPSQTVCVFVSDSEMLVTAWDNKRTWTYRKVFCAGTKTISRMKNPPARKQKTKQQKRMKRWRQNWRSCYFGVLLTGPAGRAINNLVQYLTWDLVSGGDILASFDAERAPSPKPLSPYSSSSLLKCLPWCYLCVGFL